MRAVEVEGFERGALERRFAQSPGDVDDENIVAGAEDQRARGPLQAMRMEETVVDLVALDLLGRLNLEIGQEAGILALEGTEWPDVHDVDAVAEVVVVALAVERARDIAGGFAPAIGDERTGLRAGDGRELFEDRRPIVRDRRRLIDAIEQSFVECHSPPSPHWHHTARGAGVNDQLWL